MQQENETIKRLTGHDISGIQDPAARATFIKESLKGINQQQKSQQFAELFSNKRSSQNTNPEISEELQENSSRVQNETPIWDQLSAEQKAQALHEYPQQSRALIDEAAHRRREDQKREEFEFKKNESAKGESAKSRERISTLAEGLPERRIAIDTAKAAVQSGQMKKFGGDFWATVLHVPGLKTVSGAALESAAKTNLIGSLNRIPGARPTVFLEQQIGSAFAAAGESKEAQLVKTLTAEAILDMDDNLVKTADELQDEYSGEGKVAGNEFDRELRKKTENFNKTRMNRLSYDVREQIEAEMSSDELKELKPVPKGTPLTAKMASIILDVVGDDSEKAEKVALKLGFTIPLPSYWGIE